MPEDVVMPFEYDETGDVDTVSGQKFYENHALQLGLLVSDESSGQPLTAGDVTDIVGEIQKRYRQSPYFRAPIDISVEDLSKGTITIGVILGDGTEFEIPLESPDQDSV